MASMRAWARSSKTCPDEEGIKTLRLHYMYSNPGSKTCPDEEGIKTRQVAPLAGLWAVRKHALMKKGLRPKERRRLRRACRSKTCPDEEGIKTLRLHYMYSNPGSKTCPDEEGIKTRTPSRSQISSGSKTCPDEEGIKTARGIKLILCSVRKHALMKKGLRRLHDDPFGTLLLVRKHALMKKGLRPLVAHPFCDVGKFENMP